MFFSRLFRRRPRPRGENEERRSADSQLRRELFAEQDRIRLRLNEIAADVVTRNRRPRHT